MRLARIGSEAFCIEDVKLIYAIRENLALHFSCDAAAGSNGLELYAKRVGQLAALRQKLLRHFLYLRTFYFTIYKNVVHISLSN